MKNIIINPEGYLKDPKRNKGRVYGRNGQAVTSNARIQLENDVSFGIHLHNRELFIPDSDNLGKVQKSYFRLAFWWLVKLLAIIITFPIKIINYGIVKPYRFLKYCYQIICYGVLWTLYLIYKLLRFMVIALIITVLSMVGYHIFFVN